jgi:hypothetical protein
LHQGDRLEVAGWPGTLTSGVPSFYLATNRYSVTVFRRLPPLCP